jgi:hypothetical protein
LNIIFSDGMYHYVILMIADLALAGSKSFTAI